MGIASSPNTEFVVLEPEDSGVALEFATSEING